MADRYKLKHGTDQQVSGYTGRAGEIIVSGPTRRPFIQDGSKPGGWPVDGLSHHVNPPVVNSPVEGATEVSRFPVISVNAYEGDGVHEGTLWQIALDSAFSNIVHEFDAVGEDLTSIDLNAKGIVLDKTTTYFVRAVFNSSSAGASNYSETVSFTTDAFTGLVFDQNVLLTTGNTPIYAHRGDPRAIYLNDNTIVIPLAQANDPLINNSDGAVAILTKTNGVWSVDSYIGEPDPGDSHGRFGTHIAHAKTTNRIVVSDAQTTSALGTGNIHVYDFVNNQLTHVVTFTTETGFNGAYGAIDISDDGNVLLIGSGSKDSNMGMIYVYRWNGTTYALDDSYRPPSMPVGNSRYGSAVTISGDGSRGIIATISHDGSNSTIYSGLDLLNLDPGNINLEIELSSLWPAGNSRTNVYLNPTKHDMSFDGETVYMKNGGVVYRVSKNTGSWVRYESFTAYNGGHPVFFRVTPDGSNAVMGYIHGGDVVGKHFIMERDNTPTDQHGNWISVAETEEFNYSTHVWGHGIGFNDGLTEFAADIKDPPGEVAGTFLRFYKYIQ